MLDRVLALLREKYLGSGRGELYEYLRGTLSGERTAGPCTASPGSAIRSSKFNVDRKHETTSHAERRGSGITLSRILLLDCSCLDGSPGLA